MGRENIAQREPFTQSLTWEVIPQELVGMTIAEAQKALIKKYGKRLASELAAG